MIITDGRVFLLLQLLATAIAMLLFNTATLGGSAVTTPVSPVI